MSTIEVRTEVSSEVNRLYWRLKSSTSGGVHPDFKAHLEAYGLSADIDNITWGHTAQQDQGRLRNIGVYMDGESLYDDDGAGNRSFAVVVDFLLRNADAANYLKYGDCLINYLNGLPIGWWRFVQGMSYSQLTANTNVRVTALLVVFLKPVTDSDMM